jgi:hypothetical protein
MKATLAASALIGALWFTGTADANAWTREGTVTTRWGTSSFAAQGSCANGTCVRSVTRTNPYGATVTRQGRVTCGPNACWGRSRVTGPNGNTVYRRGAVYR